MELPREIFLYTSATFMWRLCLIIHDVINTCDDTIYNLSAYVWDWSLGAHKIMHPILSLKSGVTYKQEKWVVQLQPLITQHIRKSMLSLRWALANVNASDDLRLHLYAWLSWPGWTNAVAIYNDQCLLINKNTIQLIWNCSHETVSSPKYVCLSLQI